MTESGFTVLAQRQTTDFGPDGRFADVMEVTFQTDAGTVGKVRVPLSVYSADEVRRRIAAYVEHIAAVESL